MNRGSIRQSTGVKIVEGVRILLAAVGFGWAYAVWNPEAPSAIRILALTLAVAMCGTCAFEGLFLADSTAREKGYGSSTDGHVDPYHVQNTMWFLAATIVGVIWTIARPEAVQGYVVYVLLISLFLVFSAANHAWQAVKHGNRTWQNLNRPFLTLAMLGGGAPIVVSYL